LYSFRLQAVDAETGRERIDGAVSGEDRGELEMTQGLAVMVELREDFLHATSPGRSESGFLPAVTPW
jgi:hypothetical protein